MIQVDSKIQPRRIKGTGMFPVLIKGTGMNGTKIRRFLDVPVFVDRSK